MPGRAEPEASVASPGADGKSAGALEPSRDQPILETARPEDHEPTPGPRGRTSFRATAGAIAHIELSPAPLLGPALTFGFEVPWSPNASTWRSLLQAEVSWSEVGGVQASGGRAWFGLGLLRLHACPLRLGTEHWAIRPCGTAGLGALRSAGSDTSGPRDHTRAHVQAGVSLIAEARAGSVLGQLSGGWTFPFARDAYEFAPETFFRTPPLTFFVGVSVGADLR